MAKELFGTDGIRGVAGRYPLDPVTVRGFGLALGGWAARHKNRPDIVIGMDTRASGARLVEQVAGGLREAGASVHFAGVVTTPGIAYLTRTADFVAGVMVSASHNPHEDNGIKVFDHSGYKLPDEEEHLLEQEIFRLAENRAGGNIAPLPVEPDLDEVYLEFLASVMPSLDGVSIVVDCGNGAASRLAPALFKRLGAEVHAVACSPDGRNINRDCGALHPGFVRRHVLAEGAHLGVALDGDADRAIFVSHSGKLINGDSVLLICGRSLNEKGRLVGSDGEPVIVTTVMANLGLEKALAADEIEMVRTPVGDKYVLEEMRRRGAILGGEQSGHIIFHEFATTGDGLLTALQLLAVMGETGEDLDELSRDFKEYPQRLVSVRVKERKPIDELADVQAEIRAAEDFFGDAGRVLVRFSGTELLVRVMVEGESSLQVNRWCRKISAAVRAEMGGV